MNRLTTFCVLLAISLLMAADLPKQSPAGFQVTALKSAESDYLKAMEKASDTYKLAVAMAEKNYQKRLNDLQSIQQVKSVSGEAERIASEQKKLADSMAKCGDRFFAVMLVPASTIESVNAGVHKGMTKNELLILFPAKPESDSTSSSGDETISWVKRGASHSGGQTFGSMEDFSNQMLIPDARLGPIVERMEVTLKDGIVTDFRLEKMN